MREFLTGSRAENQLFENHTKLIRYATRVPKKLETCSTKTVLCVDAFNAIKNIRC